jgi:hypothetical protein
MSVKLMIEARDANCGAEWRSFGLSGATGEVHSCLLLSDSKKFGSVEREGYPDISRSEYNHIVPTRHYSTLYSR